MNTVSCSASENCAAGGSYNDGIGSQAFLITETNGNWGNAWEVAGALNSGEAGALSFISCNTFGFCTAEGSYTSALSPYATLYFALNSFALGR